MAAEAPPFTLQPSVPARAPISRRQVETLLSRSVAGFGAVFALQTIPTLLGQLDSFNPVWNAAVITALALSLVVGITSAVIQRSVRLSGGAIAIAYLLALATWPLAAIGRVPVDHQPWLYYFLTVATSAAAIGFSRRLAIVYLFVAPATFAVARLLVPGPTTPLQALLDSSYAVILGGAVLIIVTMLRQASAAVDVAQAAALESYAEAVRQHATEVERVQVDSIVHDSVLTTLLSAARAYTPEAKELAATMAGNAIGYLRQAAMVGPDDGSTVPMDEVAVRVLDAASTIGIRFELRTHDLGSRAVPKPVAEAIYSAAMQAMVNSNQHAGPEPVSRWLSVRGLSPVGIEVEVGDTGAGFVVDDVPHGRLGLRVSIVERVGNAGGHATVTTAPGEGTVVTVRWPAESLA